MTLAAESVTFWSENQVAEIPLDVTAEQSYALMEERNAKYPGLGLLMPTAYPGQTVLDFGCGPGHDVVDFLLEGAEFVYAADVSPKALAMTNARVKAHGWEDRCQTILLNKAARLTSVDHIHTAGVIHHVPDPVATLRRLRRTLNNHAEIRMMVYSAESDFYHRIAHDDPVAFALLADGEAPITRAWTDDEVVELATRAGLEAVYVGSYRHPGEVTGPGLSSCWSLKP